MSASEPNPRTLRIASRVLGHIEVVFLGHVRFPYQTPTRSGRLGQGND